MRHPLPAPKEGEEFIFEKYAARLLESGEMIPIVTGQLLKDNGMEPNVRYKVIIDKALEMQDRGTLHKHNWRERLMGTGLLDKKEMILFAQLLNKEL